MILAKKLYKRRFAFQTLFHIIFGQEKLKRSHLEKLESTDDCMNIDKESCISCSVCELICPSSSIKVSGKVGKNPTMANLDLKTCTDCKLCVYACPTEAIFYSNWPTKLHFNNLSKFNLIQNEKRPC